MEVTIHSLPACPWCVRAKELLVSRGIAYEEFVYGTQEEKAALVAATGQRTFPQVFVNGRLIGGFTDLQGLLDRRFDDF